MFPNSRPNQNIPSFNSSSYQQDQEDELEIDDDNFDYDDIDNDNDIYNINHVDGDNDDHDQQTRNRNIHKNIPLTSSRLDKYDLDRQQDDEEEDVDGMEEDDEEVEDGSEDEEEEEEEEDEGKEGGKVEDGEEEADIDNNVEDEDEQLNDEDGYDEDEMDENGAEEDQEEDQEDEEKDQDDDENQDEYIDHHDHQTLQGLQRSHISQFQHQRLLPTLSNYPSQHRQQHQQQHHHLPYDYLHSQQHYDPYSMSLPTADNSIRSYTHHNIQQQPRQFQHFHQQQQQQRQQQQQQPIQQSADSDSDCIVLSSDDDEEETVKAPTPPPALKPSSFQTSISTPISPPFPLKRSSDLTSESITDSHLPTMGIEKRIKTEESQDNVHANISTNITTAPTATSATTTTTTTTDNSTSLVSENVLQEKDIKTLQNIHSNIISQLSTIAPSTLQHQVELSTKVQSHFHTILEKSLQQRKYHLDEKQEFLQIFDTLRAELQSREKEIQHLKLQHTEKVEKQEDEVKKLYQKIYENVAVINTNQSLNVENIQKQQIIDRLSKENIKLQHQIDQSQDRNRDQGIQENIPHKSNATNTANEIEFLQYQHEQENRKKDDEIQQLQKQILILQKRQSTNTQYNEYITESRSIRVQNEKLQDTNLQLLHQIRELEKINLEWKTLSYPLIYKESNNASNASVASITSSDSPYQLQHPSSLAAEKQQNLQSITPQLLFDQFRLLGLESTQNQYEREIVEAKLRLAQSKIEEKDKDIQKLEDKMKENIEEIARLETKLKESELETRKSQNLCTSLQQILKTELDVKLQISKRHTTNSDIMKDDEVNWNGELRNSDLGLSKQLYELDQSQMYSLFLNFLQYQQQEQEKQEKEKIELELEFKLELEKQKKEKQEIAFDVKSLTMQY